MPNSSAGCQTCKTRRIKCDGAKPTCQRCVKSGRVCLEKSAVKKVCFSIHAEDAYASGKIKRPRGPRSSLTLFRPNIDLLARAEAYYLNYYLDALVDMPTVSTCMSECIVAWKASGRKSNMVDLAISSLSLAIFSRIQGHLPAAREAHLRYGRLLREAQVQITKSRIIRCEENDIDECLIAIVLMGWYETSMHQPANLNPKDSFGSLHSWSHYDGALAILKVWDRNLNYKAPSSIIKLVRRGMIRTAFLRNCPLLDWMWDGSRFGEHDLDLDFDEILVSAVNLRHGFKILQRVKQLQTADIVEMYINARELDEACREWAMQIPSAWSYQPHSIPNFRSKKDFYSCIVYSYAQPAYAAVWIQYFALRMLIISTRLSLLQLTQLPQLPHYTYQQQCRECTDQLNFMADSLAATIPFSLSRFTVDKKIDTYSPGGEPSINLNTDEEIRPALALPIVWPLSMASMLAGIEPKQQLWFRTVLVRLGRILGDGALECAGTDDWNHD